MSYTYKYPRLSLTVDAVVFRLSENRTEVLLIQRNNPPFEGGWALPGGFVDMHETLEEAIVRELEEETSLTDVALEQLHSFSEIHRDPRGRTVSVIFWGKLENDQEIKAGDDARSAKWFNIDQLPKLAFDHNEVTEMAIKQLTHNS